MGECADSSHLYNSHSHSDVEPPQNSTRWERGSQGMNVAFVSNAFTRHLYKGLVEVKPIRCTDLPDEDDTAEGVLSGGGVDASLVVAAIEGTWKEDVDLLQKGMYHDGVLGLKGAAHVGKSRTAWSNVNVHKSNATKRKTGTAIPYHVPSSWTRGGEAVFTEDEPPFYLYVQDPAQVRLVFTVMDDDVIGQGSPVGSAHKKLVTLIPFAKMTGQEIIDRLKGELLEKFKEGKSLSALEEENALKLKSEGWRGTIRLSSKPRKKDKNSQVAMGVAAGAALAGPVGAAVGGIMGSMYEGEVRGKVELQLRYLPFPPIDIQRSTHHVKGGLEGVSWGDMYHRFLARTHDAEPINDLEHCFFINHDETGGSCSVYRSLEQKQIFVSFRGTCKPIDLITDASITQSAWVEGEDIKDPSIPKVHDGFRKSLNSISRRLKELILATPAPGDDISQYDMLVTGHSLGGALATLFMVDIAESGIDAGRALPQVEPSDNWWKSIASAFSGNDADKDNANRAPPRPKSLKMYNFGSPRVGNKAFAGKFDQLQKDGHIDEAYRIVNGNDLVARHPRTMNALAFGNVGYDHCGATVLVSLSNTVDSGDGDGKPVVVPKVWIEGESDNSLCPVRDGSPLTSPLADGSLIDELVKSTAERLGEDDTQVTSDPKRMLNYATAMAGALAERLKTATAADLASAVGIERQFTERELRMIQSIVKGEALAHHMEDEYYMAFGRACGFDSKVGEELVEVMFDEVESNGARKA